MKKKLCPQCKVGRFRVRNASGASIVVEVDADFNIKALHENESLDGFNLDDLFCLGCSWHGSAKKLMDY